MKRWSSQNNKQTWKYGANLILHPFLIIFLILTFEFSNGILNLFDKVLGSKLQNIQKHKSFCISKSDRYTRQLNYKTTDMQSKCFSQSHRIGRLVPSFDKGKKFVVSMTWANIYNGHILIKHATCRFSRLYISPTARFCFIKFVIFSFWCSRYWFTAFGLERDASCCSFSFIFAWQRSECFFIKLWIKM